MAESFTVDTTTLKAIVDGAQRLQYLMKYRADEERLTKTDPFEIMRYALDGSLHGSRELTRPAFTLEEAVALLDRSIELQRKWLTDRRELVKAFSVQLMEDL